MDTFDILPGMLNFIIMLTRFVRHYIGPGPRAEEEAGQVFIDFLSLSSSLTYRIIRIIFPPSI